MTQRYLILIDRDRRSAELPHGLSASIANVNLQHVETFPGVHVYLGATTPRIDSPGRSLVIGRLFERATGRRIEPPDLTAIVSEDIPWWMIDQAWGGYIGLTFASSCEGIDILRDPAGLMPCVMTQNDRWVALSDEARTLKGLGLHQGQIDWPALGRHLSRREFRGRETCLVGVTEPLPGERLRIVSTGIQTEKLWTPSRFCGRGTDQPTETIISTLGSTIGQCVTSWARDHSVLLLLLSGGLDSSIIAACVPDAAHRLKGLNLITGDGRGNEQAEARMVADHLGFELCSISLSAQDTQPDRSFAADSARPSGRLFTQPVDRAGQRSAERFSATAHLTGVGGDNVLGFLHSANPAADCLRIHGFGPSFARTVIDLSSVTECSPWLVARKALRKGLFDRPRFRWAVDHSLLSDIAEEPDRSQHPWLDDIEALLPGQREHIVSIMRSIAVVDHLNITGDLPTFYPFLSQPVVELCLSIPTWLQCRGGLNRALAREAFSRILPGPIVNRRSKGAFDNLALRIVETHRATIEAMLMDGELARHRVIDIQKVQEALRKPSVSNTSYGRILDLVDAEAWAAAWPSS